jgi:hypothetical protein
VNDTDRTPAEERENRLDILTRRHSASPTFRALVLEGRRPYAEGILLTTDLEELLTAYDLARVEAGLERVHARRKVARAALDRVVGGGR